MPASTALWIDDANGWIWLTPVWSGERSVVLGVAHASWVVERRDGKLGTYFLQVSPPAPDGPALYAHTDKAVVDGVRSIDTRLGRPGTFAWYWRSRRVRNRDLPAAWWKRSGERPTWWAAAESLRGNLV